MAGAAIAMGPWARGPTGGSSVVDPFRMMNEAMALRNTQADWQAKTNLSGIMASSNGDTDLMRQKAMADPYSAWMLPQIKTMQDMQLTNAQIKTQEFHQAQIDALTHQTTSNSAYGVVEHALTNAGGNAKNFENLLDAGASLLSPDQQRETAKYLDNVKHAYTDPDPTNPDADPNFVYQNRAFAGIIGAGHNADAASAMTTGTVPISPTVVGGQLMGGLQVYRPGAVGQTAIAPAGLGGGGGGVPPAPAPAGLGIGAGGGLAMPPPITPSGAPMPGIGAGGGGGAAPQGVAPTVSPGDPDEPGPIVAPPINPFQSTPPLSIHQSGDGRALYTPGQVPQTGWDLPVGPTGYVFNPSQQKADSAAAEEFTGDKAEEAYRNAQANMGSLQVTDTDLDRLQGVGGGFLSPGMGEQFRSRFANRLNTISSIAGLGNIFDSTKVGSAESLNKELNRLALNVAHTTFGGQREAAVTIERIAQSVPGMDNSYFGSKMLVAGIRANMQREIDAYNFANQWIQDPVHHGSYYGADVAFNQKHPAVDYVNRAMQPFGMTQDAKGDLRFASPQMVVQWAEHGIISKQTAANAIHRQWPNMRWQ